MYVHPLVFHRFPQALDEHIISPGTAPVHAAVAPPILDRMHKRLRGNLAPLVGIHNLRLAMAIERLLQHIDRMAGLQRNRDG
jgi:hypothetical protein